MKNNQKITRLQLKIDQNSESVIIGIVSSEPDYKLSLILNRKLKISLKNIAPVILTDKSGSDLTFSRFSNLSSSPDLLYDLTSNRCGKNFLIGKLKNIDFIFQIHYPESDDGIDRIISILRETECVTAAFKIDTKSLKDKYLQYIIQ
jgi:hypothetical protein